MPRPPFRFNTGILFVLIFVTLPWRIFAQDQIDFEAKRKALVAEMTREVMVLFQPNQAVKVESPYWQQTYDHINAMLDPYVAYCKVYNGKKPDADEGNSRFREMKSKLDDRRKQDTLSWGGKTEKGFPHEIDTLLFDLAFYTGRSSTGYLKQLFELYNERALPGQPTESQVNKTSKVYFLWKEFFWSLIHHYNPESSWASRVLRKTYHNRAVYYSEMEGPTLEDYLRQTDSSLYFVENACAIVGAELNCDSAFLHIHLVRSTRYSEADLAGEAKDQMDSMMVLALEQALNFDSVNVHANYNLAVHYYNLGVERMERLETLEPGEEPYSPQQYVCSVMGKAWPYVVRLKRHAPEYHRELVEIMDKGIQHSYCHLWARRND